MSDVFFIAIDPDITKIFNNRVFFDLSEAFKECNEANDLVKKNVFSVYKIVDATIDKKTEPTSLREVNQVLKGHGDDPPSERKPFQRKYPRNYDRSPRFQDRRY